MISIKFSRNISKTFKFVMGINKILTIAIPTYNRASVFERSLSIICPQIKRFRDDVEFIISDNCSPDNTTEVVKYYIDEGMPVRYIKNDYNLGSSLNIINCYKMAKGKYVWVLGDDDYLTEDAIGFIINILRNDKDYGLLFYSICCEGSGFTEYKDKKGIFCKYKLYNSLD